MYLCVARSGNVLLYMKTTVVDLPQRYAFLFSSFSKNSSSFVGNGEVVVEAVSGRREEDTDRHDTLTHLARLV